MEQTLKVIPDPTRPSWLLRWSGLEMQLMIFRGVVQPLYFGPEREGIPEAPSFPYMCSLCQGRSEATVTVGDRDDLVLWESWEWSSDERVFTLTLQAEGHPLRAQLIYDTDPENGVLIRKNVLENTSEDCTVPISEATSFAARLPVGVSEVVVLPGLWCAEAQIERRQISSATTLIESRNGKTGFEYVPYIGFPSESLSYAFELCWSGNWQMSARRINEVGVDVGGGLNRHGFRHRLRPGEKMELPEAILVCAKGDSNAAAQLLHDRLRGRRPDPDRPIPTQYNTWLASEGMPSVERMKALAGPAAEMGLEVFVLDAGWYTTDEENARPEPSDGHNAWSTKKGDWVADKWLYPNGLSELAEHCRSLEMGFGIWFEPEAACEGSVICREHPEWLHKRAGILGRTAEPRIVNLGVPDAREFIKDRIFRVLDETEAVWLKLDFNTEIGQGGWADGLPEELTDQDPIYAHYKGLYQILDDIRERYPAITIEMCAGGGGRFDEEMMTHAHTNLMSDQGAAVASLSVRMGEQLAHLPARMNFFAADWTGDGGDDRPDMMFYLRASLLGAVAIGAGLDKWDAKDLKAAGQTIDMHKRWTRRGLLSSNTYHLTGQPPLDGNGDWVAFWYVSKDGRFGNLYAFRLAGGSAKRRFSLPGLDPESLHVVVVSGLVGDEIASGAKLAEGIEITIEEPFRSVFVGVHRMGAWSGK